MAGPPHAASRRGPSRRLVDRPVARYHNPPPAHAAGQTPMLPYLPQPTLSIGPVVLHAFGALVAAGILVGLWLLRARARRTSVDPEVTGRLATWSLVGGFLGAHLVDRFVYFPAETLADPWSLLRVWEGLSSFGGFAGATAGALLFIRRVRLGPAAWAHLDAVAYAFPFAWVLGRLGCFLAFDHPGSPTRFFLGQADASGIVRHNLGLEEALLSAALAAAFALLGRRARPAGFFVGLLALAYAPIRFALDMLRVVDVRYLGLTPAQYGALLLLVAGTFILARRTRAKTPRPATDPV